MSRQLLVVALALIGCSKVDVGLNGRRCGGAGDCVSGYVCDPVRKVCVRPGEVCVDADGDGSGAHCPTPDCDDADVACAADCSDSDNDGVRDCNEDCIDSDRDGYGVGTGCTGDDCDDRIPECNVDCTDGNGDTFPDCAPSCTDIDGDGYGIGASCAGPDCNDAAAGCIANCGIDTDADGVDDCADDCLDYDLDGYGVGTGCLGLDCNDNVATCIANCGVDSDADGIDDCADDCRDRDGDGYGAGPGCAGLDCDDQAATCIANCAPDTDADGIEDCADDCIDFDRDGFGAGAGCTGPDCDDQAATCVADCATDLDGDSVADCADNCIDADGDGYGEPGGNGSCLGSDCDEGSTTCGPDCTTDLDGDGVADCADPCIDADGDGYGVNGTGACLGPDCDDAFASCNVSCASSCVCTSGDIVTLDRTVVSCDPLLPGATSAVLIALSAHSTCANGLVGLRVRRHAVSTTPDGDVGFVRLFADVDADGALSPGDVQLAGPVAFSGGAVSFSGFDLPLAAGRPARLLVTGDVVASPATSFFALEVLDAAAFDVRDAVVSRQLGGPAPLTAGTKVIAARPCAGPTGAVDAGAGSLRVTSAKSLRSNSSEWSAGAGNESGWTQTGTATGAVLGDCSVDTSGTTALTLRDRGNRSEIVHLSTGMPVGLPLDGCSVHLRAYGARYDGTGCTADLFVNFNSVWLYRYTGASTVDAASPVIAAVAAQSGPTTSTGNCATDHIDVDIGPIYRAATGSGTLDVRLIGEAGGGIDFSDDRWIHRVPELYLRLP